MRNGAGARAAPSPRLRANPSRRPVCRCAKSTHAGHDTTRLVCPLMSKRIRDVFDLDRMCAKAENRDRIHSVCVVTNSQSESVFSGEPEPRGIAKDHLPHEPLPAAAVVPPRRGRTQHVLPPARPPRRGQRRPGAPRPHGHRLLGQPQSRLRRRRLHREHRRLPRRRGRQEVALVGVGNLGRAVLAHLEGKSPSVAIVAAFDSDPGGRRHVVYGVRCFPADHMEDLVRDLGVQIAVLTMPGAGAQQVADSLVRAGVKSLISFAPVPLHLPNDIFVEYMDITAALESAAYFARLGGEQAEPEPPPTSSPWSRNWNPCSRGQHETGRTGRAHRRARRHARRAGRHRGHQDLRRRPRQRPAQRGLRQDAARQQPRQRADAARGRAHGRARHLLRQRRRARRRGVERWRATTAPCCSSRRSASSRPAGSSTSTSRPRSAPERARPWSTYAITSRAATTPAPARPRATSSATSSASAPRPTPCAAP